MIRPPTLSILLMAGGEVMARSVEARSTTGTRLYRRRENFTVHSPERLEYLKDFNANVGMYYWFGILGIVVIITFMTWSQRFLGFLRRRKVGYRDEPIRLASRDSDDALQHDRSLRFLWFWMSALWRKYSIKTSHIAEFFFLGDLGQLFLICVYLLLNFLLIFLGTDGDIDWQAHHSAKLVHANLPLVIGLAGKNNILSKLTGFAYESLNVLHRWSARFVIVSSAIHIGGRIHVNVPNVAPNVPGSRYIAWGWAAFALFIYMIFMASRSIRNRAYQFFLMQHVTLWFVIVACLIIHRPQEQGWIWAAFALHSLDRIGRWCRILYYHAFDVVEDKDSDDKPTGTVKVLSKDTILVTVRTRQNWIPAQHVYLHCPAESPGGHPFTVANISRPLDQAHNDRPFESKQELLIRVREGLTKRIFEKAMSAKDDETTVGGRGPQAREPVPIKAWTEGPYGHESYLGKDYDTLLLVSGGSGVSYALSNAMDIVRCARAMRVGNKSRAVAVATKRLSFVWMVKTAEQVEWIGDHIRDMCNHAPPGLLHITIYITGKREESDIPVLEGYVTDDKREPVQKKEGHVEEKKTTEELTPKKVEHESVLEIRSGRPDFKEIVEHEVASTAFDGWVAIGSCGPTPMNASLSQAVSLSVHPGKVFRGELRRNIYLTIEEFGW